MPLAVGFKMGVALRTAAYRRGWFKTRRLSRPVVSVGNLSVGGTGKTPFVAFLADLLVKRGWKPSILTRGYGRRKGANMVPIEPGAARAPDPREVGDEPALLARKFPQVPIVVGADRHRAGRLAEEKFGADVHILDDGFQHLALARDVDIVLLDSTQELSDGALVPAGRLREPCDALERADIVVLTRTELADSRPIENQVRRVNSKADIFHCSTKAVGLLNVAHETTHTLDAVRGEPVDAFCGVGNPGAFFKDLEKWGMNVRGKVAFPDHCVYTAEMLNMLLSSALLGGAEDLVTTEKDAVNLPPLGRLPIPIYACVIQTEMHEADAFGAALIERLEAAKVNA